MEPFQNMSKVMLVNVTHVEESRVAVLEDGVLSGYEIETINRTHLKGNIHNAVVESVHASLDAAFVRIGPDLKGFLPLDEVNFKLLPPRGESRKQGRIGQHVHPGQKIMVQVVREPFGGKPPTVSTYFSLPGRFLVLMPGVDSAGISRKIEDGKKRERLRKILDELRPPEGFGLIVRTAGVGQTKAELQRDLRYLLRLWESIQRASSQAEFPSLVYREADLVIRTIRDHLTPDIGEVWIDSEETYERALAFVKDVIPNRARTLKLYTGERPLFNKFNLEEQIERIYKRRVPLPSGGEIVIDGTEALTAIDVNSARSKRPGDVEDTAVQTNLEAAAEVARQLQLRDLGGLVVVDFIDMLAMRNKKKVEKAMRDAMRGDRAKHDITVISKLGLMEIARQRLKSAKMAASYATCPTCDGHGLIKNVEVAGLSALRKLQTRTARGGIGRVRVDLPPEVAAWLLNQKREELLRSERRYSVQVEIRANKDLLRHEIRFETFAREKTEELTPPAEPEQVPAEPAEAAAKAEAPPVKEPAKPVAERKPGEAAETSPPAETPAEKSAEPGESRSRRRRKRRRRSKTQDTTEPAADREESSSGTVPERLVPQGIRADELMPAAVGNASGSGGKAKKGKSKTRRSRKSGTRSSRGRRGGTNRTGNGAKAAGHGGS
jgi:ribonuclease E